MDTWVNQKGYPVLNAKRNYELNNIELTQELFLSYKPESSDSDTHEYKWYIPINYATESKPHFKNTTASTWLEPKNNLVIKLTGTNKDWVIFNIQQTGISTVFLILLNLSHNYFFILIKN